MFFGRLSKQHESLSVRDDLCGVQGLPDILDKGFFVASKLGLFQAFENCRGLDALVLDGRKAAGKDCFADESDGHTQVQSRDAGPLSSSFL